MSLAFVAGGLLVVSRHFNWPWQRVCCLRNSSGFDGIVEDDAGDDDLEVDRELSPAQTLGAVRWRCFCSARRCLCDCDVSWIPVGSQLEDERAMALARLAQ